MVGFVLSMLTVASSLALLPAVSNAVPVTVWIALSLVPVRGAVQLATPESVGWCQRHGHAAVDPAARRRGVGVGCSLVDLDRRAGGAGGVPRLVGDACGSGEPRALRGDNRVSRLGTFQTGKRVVRGPDLG